MPQKTTKVEGTTTSQMPQKTTKANETLTSLQRTINTLKIISVASILIAIAAIIIAIYPYIIAIISPPLNLGHTLAGINTPLSPTDLSIINNASNNDFELAGEMYLNGTFGTGKLATVFGLSTTGTSLTLKGNALIFNGKPSVIYLGAISCVFCAENRWAMALALSRFGHFKQLYKGYSSFGDGDVPTLFWLPAEYNVSSGAVFGSNYSSNYVNFFAIEYQSPVKQSFQLPSQGLSYFVQQATSRNLSIYANISNLIISQNAFQGTPYTIWGNTIDPGADASDFGNSTPTNNTLPITYMTHQEILTQLAKPNNMFAYREYAAADLYIAMTCASLRNTAPICGLSAIQSIEKVDGY